MGMFLDAETYLSRTRIDSVKEMDTEDIEDLLIHPAERRLDEAFGLDLNTDGDPQHWWGRFEADETDKLRGKFQKDMRISVILVCDRMALNPRGLKSQTVRGASINYGAKMPHEVKSLMRRWGTPNRLFRV